MSTKLLYTKNGIPKEDVTHHFAYYGFVTPLETAVGRYWTEYKANLQYSITQFIIFMGLAIIGVGGNNLAQNIHNRRRFTIYYTVGMSRRRCLAVELTRLAIMIVLFMVGIILLGFFGLWDTLLILIPEYHGTFYLISLLYLLAVFLLTSIGFLRSSSKLKVVDGLKSFER